jgi:hypothetical protein
MKQAVRNLCWKCKSTLVTDPTKSLCERCLAAHKAQWREEHTRKPGDMRSGWLIGDECRVTLRNVEYQAKIIDMSDTSRREHNYDLVQLELTKTIKVRDWNNQEIVNVKTWIHPEPVQSYKLKKSLLK